MVGRITKKQMAEMRDELTQARLAMIHMEGRVGRSFGDRVWEPYWATWGEVNRFAGSLRSSWDEERAVDAYHTAQWALVMAVAVVREAVDERRDALAEAWLDRMARGAE